MQLLNPYGVRVIGPNSVGILNTSNGLNSYPYDGGSYELKRGPIAICSQGGMINPQSFPFADLRFGISKICDLGDMCDISGCDVLRYLAKDPQTAVIALNMEHICDVRAITITEGEVFRINEG